MWSREYSHKGLGSVLKDDTKILGDFLGTHAKELSGQPYSPSLGAIAMLSRIAKPYAKLSAR